MFVSGEKHRMLLCIYGIHRFHLIDETDEPYAIIIIKMIKNGKLMKTYRSEVESLLFNNPL